MPGSAAKATAQESGLSHAERVGRELGSSVWQDAYRRFTVLLGESKECDWVYSDRNPGSEVMMPILDDWLPWTWTNREGTASHVSS
jgi:hypothetical protein